MLYHLILKVNLDLPNSRPVPPFRQAFTIFYKAHLESWKRSWSTPLLTVIIGVAGATIPLVFIDRELELRSVRFFNATSSTSVSSFFVIGYPGVFCLAWSLRPLNITATLGNITEFLPITNVSQITRTFVQFHFSKIFLNFFLGGVALFSYWISLIVTSLVIKLLTMWALAYFICSAWTKSSGDLGNSDLALLFGPSKI